MPFFGPGTNVCARELSFEKNIISRLKIQRLPELDSRFCTSPTKPANSHAQSAICDRLLPSSVAPPGKSLALANPLQILSTPIMIFLHHDPPSSPQLLFLSADNYFGKLIRCLPVPVKAKTVNSSKSNHHDIPTNC